MLACTATTEKNSRTYPVFRDVLWHAPERTELPPGEAYIRLDAALSALTNAARESEIVPRLYTLDAQHYRGDVTLDWHGAPPPGGSLLVKRPQGWVGSPHVYRWDQEYYGFALWGWGVDLTERATIEGNVHITGSWLRVERLHITGGLTVAPQSQGVVFNDCRIDGEIRVQTSSACIFTDCEIDNQSTPPPHVLLHRCRQRGEERAPIVASRIAWRIARKPWQGGGRLLCVASDAAPLLAGCYASVASALQQAHPCDEIRLLTGVHLSNHTLRYNGDGFVTISADKGASIEGTWFLQASRLRLSGLHFNYSQQLALVLGPGSRENIIENCNFARSGEGPLELQNPLYILGPNAGGNVIQNSSFDNRPTEDWHLTRHIFAGGTNCVGIQLCDGHGNHFNRIQGNRICGFTYGIQLGHGSTVDMSGYNFVRGNDIHDCGDALHIKTTRNSVRANHFHDTRLRGVTLRCGERNLLANNHIENCAEDGVRIMAEEHLLRGNCIRKTGGFGVFLNGAFAGNRLNHQNPSSSDVRVVNNCIERAAKGICGQATASGEVNCG